MSPKWRKKRRKKEAAKKLENRKRKQEAENERLLDKVPYPRSGLSSLSTTSSEDEDGDFKAPATKLPRRAPTNKLSLNIKLTSVWDREGLSVRQASSAYIATAKDLGHDVSQLVISHEHCPSFKDQEQGDTCHSTGKGGFQVSSSVGSPLGRQTTTESDFEMGFRGPHCRVATGQNFEEILGVPVAQMERDKKSQGRFSRRSSESVPGSRSLAFPSIRRPRTAACSQAPVYTWKISSVAPCSGWHAGTTYWRLP
ncbi:hypothetical protein GWK47_046084 [Chionoecetes opilio]|uniref:Uncharacterized protein n=1 Tax=Chionoecetes opilio TaxID=41210 RepID=A0A8J4YE93_CHIOP|nr:hypothetical protein GWK47_046084 [Chionoecetes opilio]